MAKGSTQASSPGWFSYNTTINFIPPGNEFNADLITTNNWEGGIVCNYVRKSKNQVWAFKMWLSEGFTITITGKKIRGNPGNWLIINGTQKYILTERMFRKKFRSI